MSLIASIKEKKKVSQWVDFLKPETDEVLARFRIRGISYNEFVVASERANNQIFQKGFDVQNIQSDSKPYHELILEAFAHLVEDWQNVQFAENGEPKDVPCTYENVVKLFKLGDIGIDIQQFVKVSAERIQLEADLEKMDILGKQESSTSGLDMEVIP